MVHPLGLELGCLILLAAGALGAAVAHPHAAKSRAAVLGFAIPGASLLLAAAMLLALAGLELAAPVFSTGGLFLASAWVFAPSRHSRFREFERMFWDYVVHHES